MYISEYQPESDEISTTVPGVRRVDEAPAADVHADVAEVVEEDEVAPGRRSARETWGAGAILVAGHARASERRAAL